MITICDTLSGYSFENPCGDIIYRVHVYRTDFLEVDYTYVYGSKKELRQAHLFLRNFASISTYVHPHIDEHNDVRLVVDIYARIRD